MKMKIIPVLVVTTFGLMAVPALLAQGCCGAQSGQHAGCGGGGAAPAAGQGTHGAHGVAQATTANTNSVAHPALMQPVQSVFENYLKVQTALAQDAFEGVPETATVMAQAIRGDSNKRLSPQVARQVDALAEAKDVEAAREAFKPLSQSLLQYLKANKVPPGTYYEVYCPMAKASWLQTGKTVANPYMGQAMLRCGQIKR